LKARTGELTPPGIRRWAAAKISWERVVWYIAGVVVAETGLI
jgi:hypothetical protein